MRLSFASTFAALVLTIPAFAQEQAAPANKPIRPNTATKVNGIAAKVNGEVITMNELMIRVAPNESVLMSQFPRRGPAFQRQVKMLRESVLNELIDRTIIYSENKQVIGNIPDHAVEEEIKRIIRTVYAGDRKRFRAFLKETDVTRAKFKEQQRKEILVSAIKAQHYGESLPPSEAELKAEYAKWAIASRDRTKDVGTYYKVYIPKRDRQNPNASQNQQLELAEGLAKQLKADPSKFSEIATEYSRDSKAAEGGLWENIPRTDLNHEFAFAIFEPEDKNVIGPIEDRFGYNIIQTIKRKYGPSEPFSKVRDKMKQRIQGQKKKANFEKWMKKLRARVPIEKMI